MLIEGSCLFKSICKNKKSMLSFFIWLCIDLKSLFPGEQNPKDVMNGKESISEATSGLPETHGEFLCVFFKYLFSVCGRYSCLVLNTGADFNFDPQD